MSDAAWTGIGGTVIAVVTLVVSFFQAKLKMQTDRLEADLCWNDMPPLNRGTWIFLKKSIDRFFGGITAVIFEAIGENGGAKFGVMGKLAPSEKLKKIIFTPRPTGPFQGHSFGKVFSESQSFRRKITDRLRDPRHDDMPKEGEQVSSFQWPISPVTVLGRHGQKAVDLIAIVGETQHLPTTAVSDH